MLDLNKNKKYLLACSFGPDSMALFDMLLKEGYSFSAALVNYNLRKESEYEMNCFITFCEEHNISYFVKHVQAGQMKGNVEENCRIIRYQWFSELLKVNNFDAVLVGQHQDDSIETYIMQKRRNNQVIYYGIAPAVNLFGAKVIRPLLNYTKKELKDYCDENSVPYAIDSSNLEDKYLRNKIRHSIIDKLTPNKRAAILLEMDKANKDLKKIREKVLSLDLINVHSYGKLNEIEAAYALNILVKKVDPKVYISAKFSKEIMKIISSPKPHVVFKIHDNLFFFKDYEIIAFCNDIYEKSYNFVVESPCVVDTKYFFLDCTKDVSDRNIHPNDFPLTIRNANKKDKVRIKDYMVEVRRLFIDWKVPLQKRVTWPIILNKDGLIIYIPRYKKNFVPPEGCNFYVK